MAAFVYMLASGRNGTLYLGSTIDLSRRVREHQLALTPGFTSRYGVTVLVWYEAYDRVVEARQREYALKKWRRAWKIALIEIDNPNWCDLSIDLIWAIGANACGAASRRVVVLVPGSPSASLQSSGKGDWRPKRENPAYTSGSARASPW
ncbi:GIY-YIG nuclease family protein [Methylobacterium oryzisoli]|uniref:GIY-YIG nuclease family protein n=1 Tax=Methylobacterium oryzisoli TaxID=3385502 RepID=UPI00389209D6